MCDLYPRYDILHEPYSGNPRTSRQDDGALRVGGLGFVTSVLDGTLRAGVSTCITPFLAYKCSSFYLSSFSCLSSFSFSCSLISFSVFFQQCVMFFFPFQIQSFQFLHSILEFLLISSLPCFSILMFFFFFLSSYFPVSLSAACHSFSPS